MTEQQGEHLAALTEAYATLRPDYLQWAATALTDDRPVAIAYYQRAMVAWYEATARAQVPYDGEVAKFVQALARYYAAPGEANQPNTSEKLAFATDRRPLDYIPRSVRMNARQLTLLAHFKELPKACRELLLMVRYHHISHRRIAQVLNLAEGERQVDERLHKCDTMATELWAAAGLTDPTRPISPSDEQLIADYLAGTLETTDRWAVEARLPTDAGFRETLELHQDWSGVLLVAGRQDLMQVLAREEAELASQAGRAGSEPGALASSTAPAAAPDVTLSRRRRWYDDLTAPNWQTVVAMFLVAVLTYLAWTTFGGAAPERRAATNFEPYPNIFTTDPPETAEDRDLQRILYYYDGGDYLTAYDELLPVADGYPAAPLYLGVSALALEQPSRALDWFERIPPEGNFRAPADWYTALAYLAMNRAEAAKLELQRIQATSGHPYRTRAAQLLPTL